MNYDHTEKANRAGVKKILILTANPRATDRLRLDQEVREIDEGLRRSKRRDQFELTQRWAVRIQDLRRALLDEEPHLVHFFGHGSTATDSPQADHRGGVFLEAEGREGGIVLEDEHGKSHPVDKEALAELFGILSKGMEGVVLNACYSEAQADAISRHIPYVMGMKRAVSDEAAIAFAVGFYDGIGAGKPIEQAFQLGCNAIRLAHLPEHLTPILKKNPDARQPTAKDVETPPEAPDAAAPPSPGAQLIQKAHVEEGSSYQAGRDIIIQQPEKPETLRRKVAVWLGIFAALATMLTFVLTQTSGEDEVPDSAHLFGLVYDENSDPMDRAVIEVRRTEGDTTRIGHFTTQRDGAFDFGVQSKPGSTVWVTVTRNDTLGYANAVTLLGNTIINFEAPDD